MPQRPKTSYSTPQKFPPVLSYINSKLRDDSSAARLGSAAPSRPRTATTQFLRSNIDSRPTTADAADIFRRRTRRGKAFLKDNEASEEVLPQPLPTGIPYVASYTTFDELIERNILAQTAAVQVHLNTEDVRIMYEAKCLDQDLKPTWDREVRFMELLSSNCKGTLFSLKENGLGAMCAEAVMHTLAKNEHYAILDLGGNRLRDAGACSMANLLEQNRHLVHLNMKSNDVGYVGGEAIANALLTNNTLTSLDMGGISGINRNHLGSRGAAAIGRTLRSNQVLAFLNLSSNGLGHAGVSLLAQGLEDNITLLQLDLSSNNLGPLGAKALASVLESSALEKLNLERNALGDDGAEDLSASLIRNAENGIETIHTLLLGDNEIHEAGSHAVSTWLRQSNCIQVLKLNDNPLAAGAQELAEAIKDNRYLTEISVQSCGLRAHEGRLFGTCLASNKWLKHLDISKNRIGESGAKVIADALRVNRKLEILNMSTCAAGNDGGKALAVALAENETLVELNLRKNLMGHEAGDALDEGLRRNTGLRKLDLTYNDFPFGTNQSINTSLKRNGERWQAEEVPRLEAQMSGLDEDQRELYKVQEEIDLERRITKDRGDDLLKKKEHNRVVQERFKRDLDAAKDEESEWLERQQQIEAVFREEDEKVASQKEQFERKVNAMNMRINNERDKREAMEREMDKLRKKLMAIRQQEAVDLKPLQEQYDKIDNDRRSDMSDAKWQSELLATAELRIKSSEGKLNLSTQGVSTAPPMPVKEKAKGKPKPGAKPAPGSPTTGDAPPSPTKK